jgi:hypothetical protein
VTGSNATITMPSATPAGKFIEIRLSSTNAGLTINAGAGNQLFVATAVGAPPIAAQSGVSSYNITTNNTNANDALLVSAGSGIWYLVNCFGTGSGC